MISYLIHKFPKGTAIPEGKTAYVLLKNNSSCYSLWKASSGQKYSHLDNYCSLKSIGCVIGTENVSDLFYHYHK